MGFRVGADLNVVVESLSRIERQQAELNKRMREYLTKPRGHNRDFFRNVSVPSAPAGPLVIDLGAVPPGMMWDVKQVACFTDPFTQQLGVTQVQNNQAGTGAASAITLTVPAVPNKLNLVSGFTVSGTGATAGSTIQITLAGVEGGTQTFDYVVPAGAAAAAPTMEVTFNPPLQASGLNTAIVLTVPSFGAGNLNSAADLEAFTQSGGAQLVGAVHKGLPPEPAALITGNASTLADVIAPALSIPFTQQFGGRIAVMRGQQHLYVLVPITSGIGLFPSISATASVIEVPDTEEAMTWL